jgi:hypothetical protein
VPECDHIARKEPVSRALRRRSAIRRRQRTLATTKLPMLPNLT